MAQPYKASLCLATTGNYCLPGSASNDLLIYTGNSNQTILIGVSNTSTLMTVNGYNGSVNFAGNVSFSNQMALAGVMITQKTSTLTNNVTSGITSVHGFSNCTGTVHVYMDSGSNSIIFMQSNLVGTDSEYIRITSNGFLGINTSNPGSLLAVAGNAAIGVAYSNVIAPVNGLIIQSNLGIATSNPASLLAVSGNASIGSAYSNVSAPLNGMIIQSNVGIGTSNPNSTLTLGDGTSNSYNSTSFTLFGNDIPGSSLPMVVQSDLRQTATTLGRMLRLVSTNTNNLTTLYDLAITNNSSFQISTNAGNPNFIITSNANIGIGTSNPGSLLSVAGGASVGTAYSNVVAPVNGMLIQSNTGIGTSNPASLLAVAGTVSIGTAYSNVVAPTNGMIIQGLLGIGTSNPGSLLSVAGGVGIGLAYSNVIAPSQGLIIQSNVGIGTSNPKNLLNVAGGVGIGAAYSNVVASANGLIVQGNVGIGMSNPLSLLTVSGGATIGASYSNVTAPANCLLVQCNLGLGMSNPIYPLDVNGSIRVNNLLLANNKLIILYDNNSNEAITTGSNFYGFGMNINTMRYQVPVGGVHQFYNGCNAFFTMSNNNIGVSKSNPVYNLDVIGDVNFTGTLRQNGSPFSTGVSSQWSALFNNVYLLSSNLGLGTSNPGSLLAVAGGVSIGTAYSNVSAPSNSLIIQSNLGIGKSNPSYALDVNGDVNFTGILRSGGIPYIGSQWSNSSTNVFLLSSNVGIGNSNPLYPLDVTGTIKAINVYTLSNDSAAFPSHSFYQDSNTGMFHASNQVLGFSAGGSEKMRITSNGFVGINNPSPSNALDVIGTANIQGNLQIAGSFNTNGIKILKANGIQANITSSTVVGVSNDTSGMVLSIACNTSNYSLRLLGNATELMRVNGLGYMGLGTTNPLYPLDVLGDLNFTGVLRQGGIPYVGSQWSNSGSNVFLIGSNIGIGKSNPTATLDILGTLNVSSNVVINGSLTVSNISYITSNITIYNSEIVYSNLNVYGVTTVASNIMPLSNLVYDLGSSNMRFRSIYLGSNTIDMSGVQIHVDSATGGLKITDSNNSNATLIVNKILLGTTSNSVAMSLDSNNNIQFSTVTSVNGVTTSNNSTVGGWSNSGSNVFLLGSNVGIGTSNATEGLDIRGLNAKVGCNMYVMSNLGIGKSNPGYALDVNGDINFKNGSIRSNGILYVGSQWSNNSTNVFLLGSNVGIDTNAPSERLDIQGANAKVGCNLYVMSNLGISKSNPGYALDVKGDINFANGALRSNGILYVGSQWSNNGTNVFLLGSNVGIGTSNPAYPLDVNGIINVNTNFVTCYNLNVIQNETITGNNIIPLDGSSSFVTNSLINSSGITVTFSTTTNVIKNTSGMNLYVRVKANNFVNSRSGNDTSMTWFITNQTTGISSSIVTGYTTTNSLLIKSNESIAIIPVSTTQWYNVSGPAWILQIAPATILQIGGDVSACNLGIGKSNPAYALDVVGDINFTSGSLRSNGILYVGSQWSNNGTNVFLLGSNVGIGTITPSNLLTVAGAASVGAAYSNITGSANGLIVQGSLGVGTASPAYSLDVAGTIRLNIAGTTNNKLLVLYDGGPADTVATACNFYGFGINSGTLRYQVPIGQLHSWYTGNNQSMILNGSGNLGIGTTSPGSLLAVAGGQTIGAAYANLAAPTNGLIVQGNVGIGITPAYTFDVNGTAHANSLIVGNSSTQNAIYFNGVTGDGNTYYTMMLERLFDPAGGTNVTTDYSELLLAKFNDGGQDRIRYLAPIHKWQVYNNGISPGDTAAILADNNYTTAMYINSTGNVGIGTTSPTFPLDVSGTIRGSNIYTSSNDSAALPGYSFYQDTNTGMFHASNQAIGFSAGGSEKMRITSSGYVGINNPAPSNALDIIGTASIQGNLQMNGAFIARGMRVYKGNGIVSNITTSSVQGLSNDTTGMVLSVASNTSAYSLRVLGNATEVMRVTGNGNVGIGTNNPTSIMHIANANSRAASIIVQGTQPGILLNNTSITRQWNMWVANNNIGDSAPNGTLEFFDQTSSVVSLALAPTTGYVGIGTTSPINPLTVSGNANVTGTLTAGSFSGNVTGNVTGTSTGLSGAPNITVGTLNTNSTINSQNNTISAGSGSVNGGTFNCSSIYSGTFAINGRSVGLANGGTNGFTSVGTDGDHAIVWGYTGGYLGSTRDGNRTISLNWDNGGNVAITANLSKGSGSFIIDHLDPVKKELGYKLRHCFVESPTRGDNIYRFRVVTTDLKASITLPDYFSYLNEDIQVWVSAIDVLGYGKGVVNSELIYANIEVSKDGTYNVLIIGTRKDQLAKTHFDDDGGVEFIPKNKIL